MAPDLGHEPAGRGEHAVRSIAPELPIEVAVILLGTRWEDPLDELRPRY